LKTRETGGQVFACGPGGGLNGGVPLSFLVENDLGSGKNVGFGKEDGTVIERSKLDFFGVSSPILFLFFIERQTFIISIFLTDKFFL
jgi:hypothetical protein